MNWTTKEDYDYYQGGTYIVDEGINVCRIEDDKYTTILLSAPRMLELLKQVERVYGDRYPDIVDIIDKVEGRT